MSGPERGTAKVIADRIELQTKIRTQYADKVFENVRELCMTCKHLHNELNEHCLLLPVTSTGGNCPYYVHDRMSM